MIVPHRISDMTASTWKLVHVHFANEWCGHMEPHQDRWLDLLPTTIPGAFQLVLEKRDRP